MGSSPEDILNKLFPIDASEGSTPVADLILGFDDLSYENEASELLLTLPEEAIALIHRYVFVDEIDAVDHIDNLAELVRNLDDRDPRRKFTEDVEFLKREIDRVRGFLSLIIEYDKLPILSETNTPGGVDLELSITGWFVVSTDLHMGRSAARKHIGLLGLMEAFLDDPVSQRAQYDEAMHLYDSETLTNKTISLSSNEMAD